MYELNVAQTEAVGGSGAIASFIGGKIATWIYQQVVAGNVDYSSIAEQQGSYYNTVGA